MRRRPRACNLSFSFMPSRLHLQQGVQPYIKHGQQSWAWLGSSTSSFQSYISVCDLQPKSVSLRRGTPAYVKYIRNDSTTSPLVTGRKDLKQPIKAIDRQKTSLESGETPDIRSSDGVTDGTKNTLKRNGNAPSSNSFRERFRSTQAKQHTNGSPSADRNSRRRQIAEPNSSQTGSGSVENGVSGEQNILHAIQEGTPSEKHEVMQLIREGSKVLTVHEFNDIIMSLARQKRYNEALDLATLAERRPLKDLITKSKSAKTYTILIDLYGRAQELDRAMSVFRSMARKGIQPNIVTYNAMIAACSRNREPGLAHEVYEEMQENGLRPDKFTYGTLIDLSAKSGDIERAFELSQQMLENGVRKDQTIYSALMEACGRGGQPNRAFEVFENMKKDGVWPNLVVFSVLIDICATARDPERAFNIFAEARHWGFQKLNVVVYTALIDACAKGGCPDRAELVLKSMIEDGVKPNHITFGTLIDGWARKGEFDKAFEVFTRMEVEHEVKPTPILIGGLIDACRRYRQCSRVKELWDTIVRYNLKPSRLYYPGLIGMAVSAGELQIACAIVLHAYARGSLWRVSLSSDVPGLQAMACALIYLRHELKVSGGNNAQEYRRMAERLHVVFESVAMTSEEMDNMPPSEARDFCVSWGDPGAENDGHPTHRQRPLTRGRINTRRSGR